MERPAARPERGTALLVALFAAVVIVLIGTVHLLMSGTETEIASNESAALQARYAAESAAQVVRLWFEQPGDAPAFPDAAAVVRDREIEPQYKEDVDLDGDGVDDLFAWPHAGEVRSTFLGTRAAPDVRVDDPAALQALSEVAFGGFPSAATGLRAVVRRVDVRAPPYVRSGAGFRPHGTATVEVHAAIERQRGLSVETLAERRAILVLGAVPYTAGLFGALHACGDAEIRGAHGVAWGALVVGGALHADTLPAVPAGPPRGLPGPAGEDRLWTADPTWVAAYAAALDPASVLVDPWVRLLAGGPIAGAPSGAVQPWADPPPPPPGAPAYWNCCDGSNAFQLTGPAGCPEFQYALWKRLAQSGVRGTHYLAWDGTGAWLDGSGSPRSFDEIFAAAAGEPGLWFFDTADGQAPRDDDGDGRADNLTPTLAPAPGWQARGFVLLHAERLVVSGLAAGMPETLQAPGEPSVGPPHGWIDLDYPHDLASTFGPAAPGPWDARGPEIEAAVTFRGVLVTAGDLEVGGGGLLYGAVVARSVLLDGSAPPVTRLLRDATLDAGWPPAGWGLPRFIVLQHRLE